MSDSQWVKIPVGGGNWIRFDPLTDEDMEAVVKRLDTDYLDRGGPDMAGRFAEAWLDVARLISTFASVQSLVAIEVEARASFPPPLDAIRAALTDEDEIAHAEAVTQNLDGTYLGVGLCAYCDDDWPCRTQQGINRILARLEVGQ